RLRAAARRGERGARPEAALEPAPGEPGGVQQVADVLPRHRHRVAGRAVVVVRLRVRDERVAALAVGHRGPVAVAAVDHLADVTGVTGGEVDGTGRRRPERRPERVVAHRELVGVVPQPGDGLAVVVVEDVVGVAGLAGRALAGAGPDGGDELVH